jgi:hypothetical protein
LSLILLNLATGRNLTDFPGVLHDPATSLPSVLPLSRVANELLLRTELAHSYHFAGGPTGSEDDGHVRRHFIDGPRLR